MRETLESLDGIQRAEPAPWFFTRLQARLERSERNIWETAGRFLSRPVIAGVGLFIVLAVNIFFVAGTVSKDTPSQGYTITTEDESIATAVNTFEYENLEP